MIKIKFHKFLYIFGIFFLFKINLSVAGLDLRDLEFGEGHPKTYTLFMVDTSLALERSHTHQERFLSGMISYLHPKLITSKDVFFSTGKKKKHPEEDKWVKVYPGSPLIIKLLKNAHTGGVESFIGSLTGELAREEEGFKFNGALIVMPRDKSSKSMVYGFGKGWKSLLNPEIIIPDWGLRLAASIDVLSSKRVRSIKAHHFRKATPSTRTETSSRFGSIADFEMEVGSEGLEKIKVKPKAVYGSTHCVEGQEFFKFEVELSEDVDAKKTLESLIQVADHFSDITTGKDFEVHESFRPFIDTEITDKKLIVELNEEFAGILANSDIRDLIFLHHKVWSEFGGKNLIFGLKDDRDIFPVLKKIKKPTVDTIISVKSGPRSKTQYQPNIGRLLYSLPIPHENNFYRFERGRWFLVDGSRFRSIREVLRKTRVLGKSLGLPHYTYKDAQYTPSYPENNYNRRAVDVLNGLPDCEAVLLDRLNVTLERGSSHKFELADILLKRKGEFYLLHVKREKAASLSHHREQVERSADFLGTELNTNKAQKLFLEAAVKSLYYKHLGKDIGIPTGQFTYGTKFLDDEVTKKGKPRALSKFLKKSTKKKKKFQEEKLRKMVSEEIDCKFFQMHREEFFVIMNALWDCVAQNKLNLNHKEEANTIIRNFVESVKQAIEARELLLPKGVLKENHRKKITIALVVIDDRRIEELKKDPKVLRDKIKALEKDKKCKKKDLEKIQKDLKSVEGKIKLSDFIKKDEKSPLFKDQDLWGLDRTRVLVQKNGFKFNIIVLNEHSSDEWDAFGIINDISSLEEGSDSDSEDSEEEKPKKKKPRKSKKKTDLKSIFGKTSLLSEKKKPNLYRYQKLRYKGVPDLAQGKYGEYLVCPTKADGDCFFHAVFTEDGEDADTIIGRAGVIRGQLCDAIQGGNYLGECKSLLYEEYLKEYVRGNRGDVPDNILQMFDLNNSYDALRPYLDAQGVDVQQPHSEDDIRAAISEGKTKQYMETLRECGGAETYIPVRPGMMCPAAIIAERQGKKLNIFTVLINTGLDKIARYSLGFLKSVGPNDGSPPINLLIEGNHFVRLYNPAESDLHRLQAEQIIRNS